MGFYPCVDLSIYNSKHARNSGAQNVVHYQCVGHLESYEMCEIVSASVGKLLKVQHLAMISDH